MQSQSKRMVLGLSAMERLRGHVQALAPNVAFGFLVGEHDLSVIYAALPVGHVFSTKSFATMKDELRLLYPEAEKFALTRKLGIIGIYCGAHVDKTETWEHIHPNLVDPIILECRTTYGRRRYPNPPGFALGLPSMRSRSL